MFGVLCGLTDTVGLDLGPEYTVLILYLCRRTPAVVGRNTFFHLLHEIIQIPLGSRREGHF